MVGLQALRAEERPVHGAAERARSADDEGVSHHHVTEFEGVLLVKIECVRNRDGAQ